MTLRSRRLATSLILLAVLSLGCSTYRAAKLYQTGSASIGSPEPQNAISDLERAVLLAPEVSQIRNHLGIAYAEAGRFQEAIQAFESAIRLDCDNSAAFQNLKWAERRFAEVKEAGARQ